MVQFFFNGSAKGKEHGAQITSLTSREVRKSLRASNRRKEEGQKCD